MKSYRTLNSIRQLLTTKSLLSRGKDEKRPFWSPINGSKQGLIHLHILFLWINNFALFRINDFAPEQWQLLQLAKFDVILIRFGLFSIPCDFENNGFSTHYFSFHTLLVPIQYQLFFVIIVCSSGGLLVI